MEQARKQDLREVMVQALIRAVDEGKNLVVVVSDSASTSQIGPFQSRFPERLINVGIAEQNLMGIAAGLSLGGTRLSRRMQPLLPLPAPTSS